MESTLSRRFSRLRFVSAVLPALFWGVAGGQTTTAPNLQLELGTKTVEECQAELANQHNWPGPVVTVVDQGSRGRRAPAIDQHPDPGAEITIGQAMHLFIEGVDDPDDGPGLLVGLLVGIIVFETLVVAILIYLLLFPKRPPIDLTVTPPGPSGPDSGPDDNPG